MPDLNTLVKFIPVKNTELFQDFDEHEGYCSCIYVDGGIVVSNEQYKEYCAFVVKVDDLDENFFCTD